MGTSSRRRWTTPRPRLLHAHVRAVVATPRTVREFGVRARDSTRVAAPRAFVRARVEAWAVMEAPQRALDERVPLDAKLQRAAANFPCECGGCWAAGATRILLNNSIDVKAFSAAVCAALHHGAKRGANVAVVGVGGCGKSALLEPLEKVFKAAPKPQIGSTFGLANVLGAEILLWQDYAHDEGTIRFTDLLSLFVGETIDVRRPGQVNIPFKNRAPIFYSGRTPISSKDHDPAAAAELTGMMTERFKIFTFTQPLPMHERQVDWVHCGRCCAAFYVAHGMATPPPPGHPAAGASAVATNPTATRHGAAQDLSVELARLAVLHERGCLDADEFRAAKRLALGLQEP